MARQVISLAVTLAALALANSASAFRYAPSTRTYVVATSADETSPTVDAARRWLVYVSNREGRRALYAQRIDIESRSALKEIAPHPADTFDPIFSPDGKWLAFVSTRDDARGDIYVMKFPGGSPRRISDRTTADTAPRWQSEDTVVWTARSDEGTELRAATTRGESAPVAMIKRVAFPFPLISERERGLAVLAADDTNRDGVLDARDDGSVWEFDAAEMRFRQVVGALPGLREATIGKNDWSYIVCTSANGNPDILDVFDNLQPTYGRTAEEDLQTELTRLRVRALRAFEFEDTNPGAPHLPNIACDGDIPTEGTRLALLWFRAELELDRGPALSTFIREYESRFEGTTERDEYEMLAQRAAIARARTTLIDPAERTSVATAAEAALTKLDSGSNITLKREIELARAEAFLLRNERDRALDLIRDVETCPEIPDITRAQAIELRATILAASGLTTERRSALLALIRSCVGAPRAATRAAETIVAEEAAGDSDAAIVRLRALAGEYSSLPELAFLAHLEVANIARRQGRLDTAEEELRAAIANEDAPTRLRSEAVQSLADQLSAQGRYAEAVQLFDSLRTQSEPGEVSRLSDQARRGLTAQLIARGENELRMGDPALALRTFTNILKDDKESVPAWRGRIAAEAALGMTWKEPLKFDVPEDKDALWWYRVGLAQSYAANKQGAAIESLRRAISLDSSVFWYHQTLGFVLEQRGRQQIDRDALIEAFESYENAIELVPNDSGPDALAALLQNAGNVALELERNAEARRLFARRDGLSAGFASALNELLFRYQYGIASFRAYETSEAARQFTLALDLVRVAATRHPKDFPEERATALRRELIDRRALAYSQSFEWNAAAADYLALASIAPVRSMEHVRALRNRGLVLQRRADSESPQEAGATLAEARREFQNALNLLSDAKATKTPSGGLGGPLTFAFTVTAKAEAGTALLDLTPDDEERVIRGALGQIEERLGSTTSMEQSIARQIELQPRLRDENRAYYMTQRAALFLRLGDEQARQGRRAEAATSFLSALGASRFLVNGEPIRNLDIATQALGRLAELALLDADAVQVSTLQDSWTLAKRTRREPPPTGDARALIDEAAHRLLSETTAGLRGATDIIEEPQLRARLLIVRAALQERAGIDALSQPTSEPLAELTATSQAAIAFSRAAAFAEEAASQAIPGASPEESNRILLLSHAMRIRAAARTGDSESLGIARVAAEEFAISSGQAGARWWLAAQEALIAPDVETRNAAREHALALLLTILPGELQQDDIVAWSLIDALESQEWADSPTTGFGAMWNSAERWRAARLRLAFVQATPPARDDASREWLGDTLVLRNRLRDVDRRLRRLAPESPVAPQLVERRASLHAQLDALITEGRDAYLPSAWLLSPNPGSFDDISILLDAGDFLPKPVAIVLSRELNGARREFAITREGTVDLATSREALAKSHPIWIMLGEPGASAPQGVQAVQIISTNAFLSQIEAFPLTRPTAARLVRAIDLATPQSWRLESAITLEPVPNPTNADPYAWALGEDGATMSVFLGELGVTDRVEIGATGVGAATLADVRARNLTLAAMAQNAGVADARFTSAKGAETQWIGLTFDPTESRDRAMNLLDEARANALAALQSGYAEGAIPPLETIVWIKKALADSTNLAEYQQLLAQAYGDRGEFERAVTPGEEAVALLASESDPSLLAEALMRLGSDASRARQGDVATSAFERARTLFAELDRPRDELDAIVQLGITHENMNRFDEAMNAFDEAAKYAATLDDPMLEIEQQRRRSRIAFLRRSEFLVAHDILTAAEQSLNGIKVRATPLPEGVSALEANLYLDLARVQERRGLYDASESYINRALDIARNEGLADIEGEALRDSANLEWLRSDYFKSFNRQRESLAIAEATGDVPLRISLHNVAGLTAWSLNNYEDAMREFESALVLARAQRLDSEVATTLNNRALVLRARHDYEGALVGFNEAYIADRIVNNLWGMGYSRRNYGVTLIDLGRAKEALVPLAEGIEMATRIGDRTSAAKGRLFRGDALRITGDAVGAAEEYAAALESARSIPLPEVEWRALFGQAQLDRDAGRIPEAIASLKGSLDRIESLRAAIRIEEFQDGFLADKQAPYDMLVTLLLDSGDARGAFEYSERSRGRNFIDLLGNQRIQLGNVDDARLLEREKSLRIAVEDMERRVGASNEASRDRLRAGLATARRAYSDFMIELRAANPQLSAFVRVEPLELPEVQGMLEPDSRLLVYHVTESETVAWLISTNAIEVFRTPVGRADLAKRIEGLRQRMQGFEDVRSELRLLAQPLVAPLADRLAGVSHLGIVPHRELHAMPFAALPMDAAGTPLIERTALFYVPSASVLRYTLSRRPAENAAAQNILAFGNPDAGPGAPDLPFAQKEAERLALQFPEATLVTGRSATETWLTENIASFGIVHIASHGEFDPEAPLFSALRLAADDKNDGVLTSSEVFGLAVRADLVALSACQTGLGRLSNGDDIVGLNRAFVYAGTRQILSTLWRVDDVSTAVMMKHFYRAMPQTDRAEALRRAQLRTRESFPHPAHWSGAVLSGDWK
jgi:CHAT domain-containing protein